MLDPIRSEPALLAGLSAIALLLVATWIMDLFDIRNKRARQPGYSKRRAYARTMLLLWGTAAICMTAWLMSGRTAFALGLTAGEGWGALAGWGLAAAAASYVIYILARASLSKATRDEIRRQIDGAQGMDLLRPRTRLEHRDFQLLSVTAGITEEIIFRGFLIGVLSLVMPVWLAAATSLALFVLAHLYQGLSGMGRILPVSLVMTLVFLVSGSLWPAIILHVLVDASAGAMMALVDRHEKADQAGAPAV